MTPEIINMLKETANMFVFLALELTLLFLVISYLVGILQEFIPPQKSAIDPELSQWPRLFNRCTTRIYYAILFLFYNSFLEGITQGPCWFWPYDGISICEPAT